MTFHVFSGVDAASQISLLSCHVKNISLDCPENAVVLEKRVTGHSLWTFYSPSHDYEYKVSLHPKKECAPEEMQIKDKSLPSKPPPLSVYFHLS